MREGITAMGLLKYLGVRLVLVVVAFLMFVQAVLAAGPTFNDPGFANTWNRVDKPLLDLPGGIGRGYTWGPAIPQAAQVTKEAYNGGQRTVQYFDKARMEVNNPAGNPNDLFYVTTGLLVKELVTGKRQNGDNSFSQQQPSEVQVAGDTNEFGGNQVAPTYASFQSVGTFGGTENGRPSRQGQTVNERISRAGMVSTFTPLEQRLLTGYDLVTQHNIPDVFVNFANMEGPVWNGSAFVDGKVLFDNPLYVLGRPLTEAYWVRTAVRGLEQDVLVQLFERRVLTYTPANAEGFKVEMGNVGQHYYRWRYSVPQTTLTKVWEVGRDPNAMFEPSGIAVDAQGNSFVLTQSNIPIQKYDASGKLVKSWGNASGLNYPGQVVLDSQGNPFVYFGRDKQIVKYDNNGNLLAKFGSTGSGPGQYKRLTTFGIDPQNNLYVVDGDSFAILKYNNQGQFLGSIDLNNSLAYFRNNQQGQLGNSILIDGQGHIFLIGAYYQSQSNQKGVIFKFDSQGKLLFTWDDPNFSAQYATLDSQGNLYVTTYEKVGKLDNNLKVLTSWPVDYYPSGLAVDKQGVVYLPYDSLNQVKKYDSTGKFLGSFGSYSQGNGPTARWVNPAA